MLGDCQLGATANEILIDPTRLGWPDVIFKPALQGQVISKSTKKSHRGMAMRIDQTWSEKHTLELSRFYRLILECYGTRSDECNASISNAETVPLQHHASRLHRNEPGRK
ncbi:hypothetical protein PXNS11_240003 [Stutzerimonas xanthomarina]|nr:hypothetical protein PXNS11_240003 [Stutzerimonas xanthomarina]